MIAIELQKESNNDKFYQRYNKFIKRYSTHIKTNNLYPNKESKEF